MTPLVRGLLCIPLGILGGAILGYLLFQIIVPIITPFFPVTTDPYAINPYFAHIEPIGSFFRNNIGFALIIYLGGLFAPPKAQFLVSLFLFVSLLLLIVPFLTIAGSFNNKFPTTDLVEFGVFGLVALVIVWIRRRPIS
jgi:hypothetical protein